MTRKFKTGYDFWAFSHSVRKQKRFIHNPIVDEFLDALYETSKNQHKIIPVDSIVWRAQLGCDYVEMDYDGVIVDEEIPYNNDRMKPFRDSAYEGRVNPKGIPCLYVADKPETAMAEIRPWVGAFISLAALRIVRELTVIDFSSNHGKGFYLCFDETDQDTKNKSEWSLVNKAFSTPADPEMHKTAEYVPTQIIAEFFKNKGFDGIVYKSSLSEGYNLALFDLDAAEITQRYLNQTVSVNYTFSKPPH